MIEIQSIADIERLRESVDLECKLAAGRDGNGALPEDFWPTYSAFANTAGGVVLLGIREKAGKFHVEGIANPAKVRRELFDALNNRNKTSVNLLTEDLKVPFVLKGQVRQDETPVHHALREALINALVHADYSDRGIRKQIENLKAHGQIRRIGPDKGGHWEVLP